MVKLNEFAQSSVFHAYFVKKYRNDLFFHGQFLKYIQVRGITFSRTKTRHSEPASDIASDIIVNITDRNGVLSIYSTRFAVIS